MKLTYENELRSLQNWINNVNNGLTSGMPVVIDPVSANNTIYQIKAVEKGIEGEYPFMQQNLKIYLRTFLRILHMGAFL